MKLDVTDSVGSRFMSGDYTNLDIRKFSRTPYRINLNMGRILKDEKDVLLCRTHF